MTDRTKTICPLIFILRGIKNHLKILKTYIYHRHTHTFQKYALQSLNAPYSNRLENKQICAHHVNFGVNRAYLAEWRSILITLPEVNMMKWWTNTQPKRWLTKVSGQGQVSKWVRARVIILSYFHNSK